MKPICLIGRVFDCVRYARARNIFDYKIVNTVGKLHKYRYCRFVIMSQARVDEDFDKVIRILRTYQKKGTAEEYA